MKEKRTYEELVNYTQQLEEKINWLEGALKQFQSDGTRIKTRFLSNISHEIRTPMNAIIGFSHLLGEEDVDYNQREEYVDHITRNSNSLLNLLDNLIDLTMFETGNLKLKREEVRIYSLMKNVFDYFNLDRYRTNRERVALLLNVSESFKEVRIVTDGQRLNRILNCLIGNALSLTTKGVIEVGAALIDKNHMVFSVKDSGNPLLLERAKKVFENNDSEEEDWFNTSDSVGLGYKLAKGLVSVFDGEITIDGNDPRGTTIGFTIPVELVKNTQKNGVPRNTKSTLSRKD